MERKTPLYECHLERGGKIVPFAGYLLPVQYETGVIKEHLAVRTACGLFDVSHMGEFTLRGKGALDVLQRLLTNDFRGMEDGHARYSPMCNESGGTVDDLLVYRFSGEHYMLVVNASNRDKDFAWIRDRLFGDCVLEDISDTVAQLALQGPEAEAILKPLADSPLPEKYYTFTLKADVGGVSCLVSRTGYTGEDGFELYCAPGDAPALWNLLLRAGEGRGVIPCGLGARDTLRLEAAMPLYGHELREDITPREAGLGIFVKMDKPDFVGRAALEKAGIPSRKRVGLRVTGGIARENCPVFSDGAPVGFTTSGTHCPYLGYAVAMALVPRAVSEPGRVLEVEVRGRRLRAEIVPLPFYSRKK
ncbi:glycine cleavage system aminomethyltransferase GcvT [Papillibacter cinnamivorans]|uniref:Aminomethyltransferase n=1 Tax=Papillibacter cinnamivorans DSM 12816 TaxID=1122930 RepID=A0A1W1ZM87_9FIRM|nr:glycine cleavage system aminomethyltransferase GcvT [Papillibacter cinnamivorans]SMC49655.1 aminomethyltransferase [Papillibacter cinnamivorans DSM 12816]